MNVLIKIITLLAMLSTVAWFFWSPEGWVFQWEPIVVFLLALVSYINIEITTYKTQSKKINIHPNDTLRFQKFIKILPNYSFIMFLNEHDFLSDVEREKIKPLSNFIYGWDNAEYEFQNKHLEKIRKELMKSAKDLDNITSINTAPNRADFQAVD